MQCLTLSLEQSLRKESLIYRFFVASTSVQIIFPSTLSCRVGTLQISIIIYMCRTTPKSDPPTQLKHYTSVQIIFFTLYINPHPSQIHQLRSNINTRRNATSGQKVHTPHPNNRRTNNTTAQANRSSGHHSVTHCRKKNKTK